MIRLFLATAFFVGVAAAMIAVIGNPAVRRSTPAPAEGGEISSLGTSSQPGREPAAGVSVRPASASTSQPARVAPGVGGRELLLPPDDLESSMYVVTDSAPVYGSNSINGSVRRRLQEGDRIEPGLRILGADGLWIEVRLDQQPIGFVRSEDLARN